MLLFVIVALWAVGFTALLFWLSDRGHIDSALELALVAVGFVIATYLVVFVAVGLFTRQLLKRLREEGGVSLRLWDLVKLIGRQEDEVMEELKRQLHDRRG